jgi:hypothetical protein
MTVFAWCDQGQPLAAPNADPPVRQSCMHGWTVAVRWDVVLTGFEGTVDGLYLPDFTNLRRRMRGMMRRLSVAWLIVGEGA